MISVDRTWLRFRVDAPDSGRIDVLIATLLVNIDIHPAGVCAVGTIARLGPGTIVPLDTCLPRSVIG